MRREMSSRLRDPGPRHAIGHHGRGARPDDDCHIKLTDAWAGSSVDPPAERPTLVASSSIGGRGDHDMHDGEARPVRNRGSDIGRLGRRPGCRTPSRRLRRHGFSSRCSTRGCQP